MGKRTKQNYEKYKKMIGKIAWRYHLIYGQPMDELISEGNLIYAKAVKKHDSSISCFSTFLWACLEKELFTFCRNQKTHSVNDCFYSARIPQPEKEVEFKNTVETMSEEAKYIASIILSGPGELLGIDPDTRMWDIRKEIKKHLREIGWKWKDIKSSFQEIRNIL